MENQGRQTLGDEHRFLELHRTRPVSGQMAAQGPSVSAIRPLKIPGSATTQFQIHGDGAQSTLDANEKEIFAFLEERPVVAGRIVD